MRWPRIIGRILGPRVTHETTQKTAVDVSRFNAAASGHVRSAPREPFVLLLRTFGADGDVRVGNPREGPGYEKNTLESIVKKVGRDRATSVRALHDERSRLVPMGVDYLTTDNEGWFTAFLRLVEEARVIVVFSTGHVDLGDSFRKELASLCAQRVDDRVVVVFPPDLGLKCDGTKTELFDQLGWPVPPAMPLVAFRPSRSKVYVQPSLGVDDDSAAARYEFGLRQAFDHIFSLEG